MSAKILSVSAPAMEWHANKIYFVSQICSLPWLPWLGDVKLQIQRCKFFPNLNRLVVQWNPLPRIPISSSSVRRRAKGRSQTGPKGRKLEVGPWRDPRLLFRNILQSKYCSYSARVVFSSPCTLQSSNQTQLKASRVSIWDWVHLLHWVVVDKEAKGQMYFKFSPK